MKEWIKLETYISSLAGRITNDQAGATAIEYALIAAGISVVIVASVNGVGDELVNVFTSVAGLF